MDHRRGLYESGGLNMTEEKPKHAGEQAWSELEDWERELITAHVEQEEVEKQERNETMNSRIKGIVGRKGSEPKP